MNRLILSNFDVLSVVSFEVRTEYLNRPIIEASFGAKKVNANLFPASKYYLWTLV
jgi:hypothetical protein